MLIFVEKIQRLRGSESQQRYWLNILIHTVDVREGMMHQIVFGLPEKGTRTQEVQRIPHGLVDPLLRRVGTVATVMHHIEAYER